MFLLSFILATLCKTKVHVKILDYIAKLMGNFFYVVFIFKWGLFILKLALLILKTATLFAGIKIISHFYSIYLLTFFSFYLQKKCIYQRYCAVMDARYIYYVVMYRAHHNIIGITKVSTP